MYQGEVAQQFQIEVGEIVKGQLIVMVVDAFFLDRRLKRSQ